MKGYKLIMVCLCFILTACGTKNVLTSGKLKNATANKVIRRHHRSEPDFKTLQASLRGSYYNGDETQSIGISMRMRKNDTIWLSAKLAGLIPLAKVLITKNRVRFYEKINHSYFDGDFSLLSNWLGTDLDFEKVQDLLIGQAIYNLKDGTYNLETTEKGYRLLDLDASQIVKLFLIDKSNFRLVGQQFTREQNHQSVTVSYPKYQEKDKRIFPKKINIIVNQKNKTTKINIDYRSLDFNAPVSFPFKMPSDYKEIIIK